MIIKRCSIIILLFLISTMLFGEKVVEMTDIGKPSQLIVTHDRIFITEGASVYIYSLKDYSLLKKFGSAGEGPKEFKLSPFGPGLQLFPKGDQLVINSDGRISFFTMGGEFISEMRVKPFSLFIPVDDHFVGNASEADKENRMWLHLNIYNSKLEKVKTIHSTDKTIGTGLYSNLLFNTIILPYESFVYPVYKNKVYIPAETEEALVINVFDKNGSKTESIGKISLPTLIVTEHYKKEMIHWFKDLSPLKPFWDRIKDNIQFRTHFPLFKNLLIDNDRIYILTYQKNDGKNECIVLNMKGEKVKQIFLSLPPEEPFAPVCYALKDHHFYALHENEDTENWELHITSLK